MQNDTLVFVSLVGSVRRVSGSQAIANTLDELAPDDVLVNALASIGELPHFGSRAWEACYPENVIAMCMAVATADGVVIVTPEYYGSVPGSLKNALDWLGSYPGRILSGKPVAIQTISTGAYGGRGAQDHLRQTLAAFDALVINTPEVAIPYVASKVDEYTGSLRDDDARNAITLQLEAMSKAARGLKRIINAPQLA